LKFFAFCAGTPIPPIGRRPPNMSAGGAVRGGPCGDAAGVPCGGPGLT
jgi:hypothetical protein